MAERSDVAEEAAQAVSHRRLLLLYTRGGPGLAWR